MADARDTVAPVDWQAYERDAKASLEKASTLTRSRVCRLLPRARSSSSRRCARYATGRPA